MITYPRFKYYFFPDVTFYRSISANQLLTSILSLNVTDCCSLRNAIYPYGLVEIQMVRNFFQYAHTQQSTIFSIIDLALKRKKKFLTGAPPVTFSIDSHDTELDRIYTGCFIASSLIARCQIPRHFDFNMYVHNLSNFMKFWLTSQDTMLAFIFCVCL